jgi:hypothetical protein
MPKKFWNIQRQAMGYRETFGCGNLRDIDNESVMAEFQELELRLVASRFSHQITYGRGRHNNSTELLNGELDTEVADNQRIWATLTFAQSLDEKFAGHGRRQLILNRKQMKVMTRWYAKQV